VKPGIHLKNYLLLIYLLLLAFNLPADTVLLLNDLAGRTTLDGEWETSSGSEMPGEPWSTVTFPEVWYSYPEEPSATYWFRRNIFVSDTVRGKVPSLYLGKLPDVCDVYFNGSLLYSSGYMRSGHFSAQLFSAHSLVLPTGLINYGNENELVLRVYSERPFTALPSMFFSTWDDVSRKTFLMNLVNPYLGVAATAIMMLTALYFLVLFIMDNMRGKYFLMLIGSLGFAINSSVLYGTGFFLSFFFMFKIQYTGLYWGVTTILLFVMEITNYKVSNLLRNILLGVTAVLSIILLSLPTLKSTLFFNDNIVYLLWITPQLLFLLVITFRGLLQKVKYSSILLIGVVAAILGGLRDILVIQSGATPDFYTNLMGLTILITCLFTTYAAQFNHSEKLVQQRTESLIGLTKNLENLVQERTSELEKANRNLSELAITDMLTGAYNRLEFSRVLEYEDTRHQRSGLQYAALSLDLDNFKYINDTYGHPAGDCILCEVTDLMKSCMRHSDRLFRLGGDEFMILMTDIHTGEEAVLLAERILEGIHRRDGLKKELQEFTGQLVSYPAGRSLSLSIGLCSTDMTMIHSLHELYAMADTALLKAKNKGKNCYSF